MKNMCIARFSHVSDCSCPKVTKSTSQKSDSAIPILTRSFHLPTSCLLLCKASARLARDIPGTDLFIGSASFFQCSRKTGPGATSAYAYGTLSDAWMDRLLGATKHGVLKARIASLGACS